MMLICPHSGFGNQIGNYVFAEFLKEKGVDVKFLITKDGKLDREFVLDKFNVELPCAGKEDIEQFLALKTPIFSYKLLVYNILFRKRTYFNSLYKVLARIRKEYGLYPKKTPAFLAKTISFEDVLKYGCRVGAVCDCYSPIPEFNDENFKRKICGQFKLKEQMNEENKQIFDVIKSAKNPVGVHIRRGDYLNLKIPVVKSEFLIEKMEYMMKTLIEPEFFIFSDGMDWAKETLKSFNNVHFVDINDEAHGYLDFILMNECIHRIYSASSFSKWLKYLNEHQNSIEFTPENKDLTIET